MTSGEISYRRGPDTSGFLPSQFPYGSRGLQRSLTCYRFIMAMTREDRRTLTIEAMTSTGRDERIAWAVHGVTCCLTCYDHCSGILPVVEYRRGVKNESYL